MMFHDDTYYQTSTVDAIRWLISAFVAVLTGFAAWIETSHILTLLAFVVVVLTIIERILAIRLKRRQLRESENG